MRFVDTNVLIYAVSPSPEEAYKCRIAQELLSQDDLALSVQVLQEFYHQVTRPTRSHALTHAQAGTANTGRKPALPGGLPNKPHPTAWGNSPCPMNRRGLSHSCV